MKHLNETAAAPDGFFFFLTVETEGSRGIGRRFGDCKHCAANAK